MLLSSNSESMAFLSSNKSSTDKTYTISLILRGSIELWVSKLSYWFIDCFSNNDGVWINPHHQYENRCDKNWESFSSYAEHISVCCELVGSSIQIQSSVEVVVETQQSVEMVVQTLETPYESPLSNKYSLETTFSKTPFQRFISIFSESFR